MNVLGKLIAMLNRKVISKEEALTTLDVVKARIEADEDGELTVGEILSISMEVLSISTAAAAVCFALFGIIVGLAFGVSA